MRRPRLLLLLLVAASASLLAQSNPSADVAPSKAVRTLPFALPRELAPPGTHASANPRLAFHHAAQPLSAIALPFLEASYDSGAGVPTAIQIGDLNGDNIPDVVVLNECVSGSPAQCSGEGVIGVLLGNGDGTFRSVATYSTGGFTADSLALADLNHDGHLDVIALNTCGNDPNTCASGSIGILLGNGDGTLQPARILNLHHFFPSSVAVGDFNRDGNPDLVVSFFCAGARCARGLVQVYLGKGDSTFSGQKPFYSGSYLPAQVVVGDLNGDGNLDLVLPHCGSPDCFIGQVTTVLGNGDGTFRPARAFASGGVNPFAVAIADLAHAGQPDIIVANDCVSPAICGNNIVLGVLRGNGDGSVQSPQLSAPGLFSEGCGNSGYCSANVQVGDFDGDGKLDVVAGSNLFPGNGDGTLQSPQSYNPAGRVRGQVAVADLNADGAPDLVLAAFDNNQADILLNPNARATTRTALTASPSPSAFGQPVMFAALVAATSPTAPTGRVTFAEGRIVLGSAPLSGGLATLTTAALAPGRHLITAHYSGDNADRASSSPVWVQIVSKGAARCAIYTHIVYFNHALHNVFTAIVTAVPGAPVAPTGTVSFLDSAYSEITLGTAPLAGGKASITVILDSEPDPQWVKAVYSGDRNFTTCESPYLAVFTQ